MVALVVIVGLFVVLRSRGSESDSSTNGSDGAAIPAATGPAPTTSEPPILPPPTAVTPPPGPRRIRITIRDGQVRGGVARPELKRGDRVVLVVRSDLLDEVHVHGYDRSAEVGPGRPAQIALRLTIAGRFEVELEAHGLQIAELEVRS